MQGLRKSARAPCCCDAAILVNFGVVHVSANTGPLYEALGCTWRFLVSSGEANGNYTTMEIGVPPGVGPSLHLHELEEEQFYVIEGELDYEVGDDAFRACGGDFIHIPRGTLHGFKNVGATPAKLLATFGPGTGVETTFRDAGELIADAGPV
jgi:quercetin dioxygenase-like cupin family protein